jgi:predicted nucleic acid-binding protein
VSFSGILDSSVGIAWVHPAQASPATDAILHRADAGETFAVPLLWFTEMANGILVLQRRNKISPAARIAALDRLLKLNLHIDIPSPALAFTDVSSIAARYGLTVYDATYLETAIRLSAPLATRDTALAAAARVAGVPLLL